MNGTKAIKLISAILLTFGALGVGGSAVRADGGGQNGTTLDASVTGSCGVASPFTFSGNIIVHNGGGVATQGLAITAELTSPSGSVVYQTETINTGGQEISAGGTLSFPYSFTATSSGTYKVTAYITITNHSGSLGTAFGPSPSSNSFHCGPTVPTLALISHASVDHAGSSAVIHWTLVNRSGVIGFNVFAGKRRLNARTIATHARRAYAYRTHWLRGPYTLRILLQRGSSMSIKVR